MSRRVALPLVTSGYLALVAWITLGSVSGHALGDEASYGVLTPSIWFERTTWTTVAIELAQIPLADRISDPRDLLANSGGALIGIVLAGIGWLMLAAWRAATVAPVRELEQIPSPAGRRRAGAAA